MTGATVVVDTASQLAVRDTIAVGIGLMLMFVMAEMLRACVCFVLIGIVLFTQETAD